MPTDISELNNDVGYITSIPSEYVTETELNAKGYLTEHQDISNLATKNELHSHSNKIVLDEITSNEIFSYSYITLTEFMIYHTELFKTGLERLIKQI